MTPKLAGSLRMYLARHTEEKQPFIITKNSQIHALHTKKTYHE